MEVIPLLSKIILEGNPLHRILRVKHCTFGGIFKIHISDTKLFILLFPLDDMIDTYA